MPGFHSEYVALEKASAAHTLLLTIRAATMMLSQLSPTTNYRVAFLGNITRFFGPPLLIAYVFTRFVFPPLNYTQSTLLYVTLIPVYWTFKINYDVFVKKLAAQRNGAVLAPQVRGHWPGNLDVLLR